MQRVKISYRLSADMLYFIGESDIPGEMSWGKSGHVLQGQSKFYMNS